MFEIRELSSYHRGKILGTISVCHFVLIARRDGHKAYDIRLHLSFSPPSGLIMFGGGQLAALILRCLNHMVTHMPCWYCEKVVRVELNQKPAQLSCFKRSRPTLKLTFHYRLCTSVMLSTSFFSSHTSFSIFRR